MTATTNYPSAGKIADLSAGSDDESFFERWLIMPKLLYFLLNMFVYAFHGLMAIYFVKELKLSYAKYSFATSVIASNFVGAMVWGQLADRTGRYKTIIVSTCLLQTVVACLLLMKEWFPAEATMRYICVFVALFFFNFFLSAAFPLLDAQILGMLTANPKVSKEQFNNQRVFGAFGHFAATLLSFYLFDEYGRNGQIVNQLAICFAFCLAVMLGVPDVKPVKGGHHGHHAQSKSEKAGGEPVAVPRSPALTLLSNANFMFFMIFIGFSGIIRAISTNFQKIISDAVSKGSNKKNAWFDLPRMFSEVFVYWTAKYVKNALGVYWVLVFSQLVGVFRMLGYGLLATSSDYASYYTIGLELMKGFNSGLISSSAIPIAYGLAPAGCESTAQGLYSGNYSGLSMALGSVIGGCILLFLYTDDAHQLQNCQDMFFWIAIAALIITVLLTFKYIFVDRVMGIPGFPRRHSFHK